MSLSDREAFKVAFLSRCIEHGATTPDQIMACVKSAREKVAFGLGDILNVPRQIGETGKAVVDVAKGVAEPVARAGFILPIALGAGIGGGAAMLTDVDDQDVREQQQRELIGEYARLAARAEQNRLIKAYRKARSATGRTFV